MLLESYISASLTSNLTSSRPSVAESLMLLLSLRFVSLSGNHYFKKNVFLLS